MNSRVYKRELSAGSFYICLARRGLNSSRIRGLKHLWTCRVWWSAGSRDSRVSSRWMFITVHTYVKMTLGCLFRGWRSAKFEQAGQQNCFCSEEEVVWAPPTLQPQLCFAQQGLALPLLTAPGTQPDHKYPHLIYSDFYQTWTTAVGVTSRVQGPCLN